MIHIGTSGWHYKHWKGLFYPDKLPPSRQLPYYAESFPTVEVNNTFYALPLESTTQNWREFTPDHFIFAVKASRYITHVKKLKDCEEALDRFFGVIDHLKPKLGPILFQFPPNWTRNEDRLREFLQLLPKGNNYIFEFRHESWFVNAVYEILSSFGASFCLYDRGGKETPIVLTSDHVYIRFHGSEPSLHGNYPPVLLQPWAERVQSWLQEGKTVWIYFNNDWQGYAIENARTLDTLIQKFTAPKHEEMHGAFKG